MKKYLLNILSAFVLTLCSCASQSGFASFKMPNEHYPSKNIELSDLSKYEIAFCLGIDSDLNKINRQEGEKLISLHIILGDKSKNQIISTDNLRIQPSPYITPKPNGHPDGEDVGCIDSSGRDIRFNSNELFWKSDGNEIAFVSGSDPNLADYRLFETQGDLTYVEKDPPITFHDYNKYFMSPRWVYWSPDAKRFATLGLNTQIGEAGTNIWVYDIPSQKLKEITRFNEVGNPAATASWSNSGKILAVGYGGPASGIVIASFENSNQYIEISSNTNGNLLKPWPYWLTSSLFHIARSLYYGEDSIEVFNGALAFNSTPIWVNGDQQVIFVGANVKNKASLFMVNADGTNLHELLPGLPGIVLLPRISPDGKFLAFARFPDWNDRSRVEIATLDLTDTTINSLAVFPKTSDGSILFVSGMDWSPDGKYLAVSAPYNHESDIFIFSRDGASWINFTEDLDGDAVSPVWKP